MDPKLQRIVEARQHDPFALLGRHRDGSDDQLVIRVHLPHAESAALIDNEGASQGMRRVADSALFEWFGDSSQIPDRYRIRWTDDSGLEHLDYDPYAFPSQLGDLDQHLFSEGRHSSAYRFMGAHLRQVDGIDGTQFAVWAPNAERVSVVGAFNRWDGRCHPMQVRGGNGIWELFIPGIGPGELYKFEIRSREGEVMVKTDPYAQQYEVRPNNACIITLEGEYSWSDADWLEARAKWDWQHEPMSIYELHLGSWRRDEEDQFLNYRELAEQIVNYIKELGFSHIELMPVTEHPFDGSWGYQATGYFAPTSRFGSPDDFRYFVDLCHQNGIGVLLDWVPAHFPRDTVALARFDGSALYEHADPRQGEHRDWGTLIFNYGRNEVKSFLLSSALYWLEEFHIDGLRVDAVASMLYLDYSRNDGEWIPNKHGGRENLEAIDFIRELNAVTHGEQAGVLIIAEESTAWPQVTRPNWVGGLGFSLKWNMGWMNDTLEYFSKDPVYRQFHHNELTFGQIYAYTENFILPFSHDEVVHGKRSLLYRMPGDDWQRFANLRLLYTYMFSYPGKKLLFMGDELGQGDEWAFEEELPWWLLEYPHHKGIQLVVRDLLKIYHSTPPLYRCEFQSDGFAWIDCHDSTQSTLSYLRTDGEETVVIVLNFTPVVRQGFRIGVPAPGAYLEIFNSDSEYYGGSNVGNAGELLAEEKPWNDHAYSLSLTLPPLAGVMFRLKSGSASELELEE